MAAKDITTGKIYELVTSVRLELKQDIMAVGNNMTQNQARLENKFDALEAGRLTAVERQANKLQVSVATQTTKLAVVGFIAASIIGAIISVVVPRLLK